jgi:hypothetical protein
MINVWRCLGPIKCSLLILFINLILHHLNLELQDVRMTVHAFVLVAGGGSFLENIIIEVKLFSVDCVLVLVLWTYVLCSFWFSFFNIIKAVVKNVIILKFVAVTYFPVDDLTISLVL